VETILTWTQRHAWMLLWLCLGRSCGAFERSDFRVRKKTGHPAHSKNSKAWPLGKPFPWILSRVKTIPTWTQRHAWMLPWLCFDCSCGAFERSEFRRPGVIITHRTCNYCLFVPFLPFSGFLVFSLSPFLLFPFSFFLLFPCAHPCFFVFGFMCDSEKSYFWDCVK
jgi:hypothetical protein